MEIGIIQLDRSCNSYLSPAPNNAYRDECDKALVMWYAIRTQELSEYRLRDAADALRKNLEHNRDHINDPIERAIERNREGIMIDEAIEQQKYVPDSNNSNS